MPTIAIDNWYILELKVFCEAWCPGFPFCSFMNINIYIYNTKLCRLSKMRHWVIMQQYLSFLQAGGAGVLAKKNWLWLMWAYLTPCYESSFSSAKYNALYLMLPTNTETLEVIYLFSSFSPGTAGRHLRRRLVPSTKRGLSMPKFEQRVPKIGRKIHSPLSYQGHLKHI